MVSVYLNLVLTVSVYLNCSWQSLSFQEQLKKGFSAIQLKFSHLGSVLPLICQFSPVQLSIRKPGRLYISFIVWLFVWLFDHHAGNSSDVTWTLFGTFGLLLGYFSDTFGTLLFFFNTLKKILFWILLGLLDTLGYFGILLGYFWGAFGILLGYFWDAFSYFSST